MSGHTRTPWIAQGKNVTRNGVMAHGYFDKIEDAGRAVSCVNACADIPDPSAIPEAIEVLKMYVKNIAPAHDKLFNPDTCVCLDCDARRALARLEVTP